MARCDVTEAVGIDVFRSSRSDLNSKLIGTNSSLFQVQTRYDLATSEEAVSSSLFTLALAAKATST